MSQCDAGLSTFKSFGPTSPPIAPTDPKNVAVGEPYRVTDLSLGYYTITIDLSSPAPARRPPPWSLSPPTRQLPYVLAVADPQAQAAGQRHHRREPGSFPDITSSRTCRKGSAYPKARVGSRHGECCTASATILSSHWTGTSSLPQSGQTIIGANNLYTSFSPRPPVLSPCYSGNDVIDVQLIGHSRGTSVVGRAIQDLLSHWRSGPPALQEGYFELTLLDPHPANPDTVDDILKSA